MGCVFGKQPAGDGQRVAGAREISVKVEEASDPVAVDVSVNGVRVRKEEEERKKEREERRKEREERIRHRSGEFRPPERRKPRANPSLRSLHAVAASGWPEWLEAVVGDAIEGWTPRRADTFEKLDKIGQGTYSNVYKARDLITGKIVALKKVRFDNLEPESVKFMAREILVMRRLDHPNVLKLEGLVTSRMSCSLYLVFEYMEHDLSGLAACPGVKFTLPQAKCYMKQLFSGLEHCHNRGVLHRDIKGSNLLIDKDGILKIADFGLASFYDPGHRQPMTSRVVTLWYRPPELLLGATYYGVGVDLWSAGCILAELLAGKPIIPGRTEVEQLHKIFKLCGSPSEEYWKTAKFPHAAIVKPQQPYKRCIAETFKELPPSSLPLIETLLAIDPDERGTATSALNSEFFNTKPYASEPSSLPHYPPSKEMDVKLRDEEARRQRGLSGKGNGVDGVKRVRARDRGSRAVPAPEANAELQTNLDRRRLITHANAKSKSEKFPPPHQDGAVGFQLDTSHNGPSSFIAPDNSFASSVFDLPKSGGISVSGPMGNPTATGGPSRRRKTGKEEYQMGSARTFMGTLRPFSSGLLLDHRKDMRNGKRGKGKEIASEVFGGGM
ncbi:putative serine/threonine-protein kinase At1g54610 [Tasmannia lanceolata]|uniref:putative serine/threonine-protein kinase At1g54610 n=1 Tax=Tasmannia lanceolata TaxID=3420 RepID=UPI0040644E0F